MSNWISHKAQYFKKNGDIDRKKECTCFLLDTINSDLYEVVHTAFYCNVYYAAVVQTKIFNDQEYKEIPKEEQEITAMVIDTKTEKKEFIYHRYQIIRCILSFYLQTKNYRSKINSIC